MEKLKVKKLSQNATLPTRAHKTDAGLDLYAAETVTIQGLERKLIKTDIAFAIPEGYYGRISDRSGLAWKQGLHCLAGTIDAAFRSGVGVVLFNTQYPSPTNAITLQKGDRIAQMIIEKCELPEVIEVDELDDTDRGEGGWGSTGK